MKKWRFTKHQSEIRANQGRADLKREKVYHAHFITLRIYLPLVQITQD